MSTRTDNLVHKWETDRQNGLYAELLPNGNILRGAQVKDRFAVYFGGVLRRGLGARLEREKGWSGNTR